MVNILVDIGYIPEDILVYVYVTWWRFAEIFYKNEKDLKKEILNTNLCLINYLDKISVDIGNIAGEVSHYMSILSYELERYIGRYFWHK